MLLPFSDGVVTLEYAFGAEWEQNAFLRWIAGNEFGMSFNEFKEAVKPRPIKSTAQIIADVDEIMSRTQWRKSS